MTKWIIPLIVMFSSVFIILSVDDTFSRRGGSYYGSGGGYSGRGIIHQRSYGRPYQPRPYQSRPYYTSSGYVSASGSASSRDYLERNQDIAAFASRSTRNRFYSDNSIREEAYEESGAGYQGRRDVHYDWPRYYNYGSVVERLPADYTTLNSGRTTYYYSSGAYYLLRDDKYVVVAPPKGVAIRTLPPGYTTTDLGSKPYYYYQGTYYISDYSGYVVTDPPAGLTVDYLPDDYKTEVIDGVKYYTYDDVTYRPCYRDGKLVYTVVRL